MDRPIRSMPLFVYGLIAIGTGLAVLVSGLTTIRFGAAASVAGLACGSVWLVAAVLAPRFGDEPVGPAADDDVAVETDVVDGAVGTAGVIADEGESPSS